MGHLDFTTMFLLGLSGTGHCVGMCGPLVLAFPASTGRVSSHLFYHLGRVLTYTGIGALVGGAGAVLSSKLETIGVDSLVWLPKIQTGIIVLAAVFLLLIGLARLRILREPSWKFFPSPSRIPGYRSIVAAAIQEKSHAGMFLLGVIFGFLPCGLSVAAFARALASEGGTEGAVLTALFALGTVPGLLLLGTAASGPAARYRRHSDILSGLIMIGMAATLVIRLFIPHVH